MATILPFRPQDNDAHSAPITAVLNRALVILTRSLPCYLVDARPWAPMGSEQKLDVLLQVAADQTALAERIGEAILDAGGMIDAIAYPMEYTDLHDLAVDYLLREAIRYQAIDIAALQRCVDLLRTSPAPRTLVEEALGMAKGHLETLQEVAR